MCHCTVVKPATEAAFFLATPQLDEARDQRETLLRLMLRSKSAYLPIRHLLGLIHRIGHLCGNNLGMSNSVFSVHSFMPLSKIM